MSKLTPGHSYRFRSGIIVRVTKVDRTEVTAIANGMKCWLSTAAFDAQDPEDMGEEDQSNG